MMKSNSGIVRTIPNGSYRSITKHGNTRDELAMRLKSGGKESSIELYI